MSRKLSQDRNADVPDCRPLEDEALELAVHTLVEDYLDRVCRPLIDTHPYSIRAELRQEIGQHICSLRQAYEEMGDDALKAAERAIAKFGPAESVARQWKQLPQARRRMPVGRWLRSQLPGITIALSACGICAAIVGATIVRRNADAASMQATRAEVAANSRVSIFGMSHREWAAKTSCNTCHRETMQAGIVLRPERLYFGEPRMR